MLGRSINLYMGILGALKSGAAYVPLDPSYPPDRVRFIIEDAGVRAIITTSDLIENHGVAVPAVLLDVEGPRIQEESRARLERSEADSDSGDVGYIIYTSGSTGRPKGVQIEHRSIGHWIRAAQSVYGITPTDRVYQGFSVAFDASLEEMWMAWANGAALVPATPEMARAGPDLPKLLSRAGVTVLSTVPTLVSMFTEDAPSVRLLIFGGEACPDATAHRWCRPGRRVVNTYGPTEATVTATYAECRPDGPVTIGRAMPGYRVYVLDESLQPVSPGTAGELCIGGPGLARGYVNRDDPTRERFVPNPIASERDDAPRIYRTGDLVRLTESGDLQFLGRADDQVKIRGYRVELSEIESQLLTAPGVRAAAVAVREVTPGIESLVAYVVLADPRTEPDWHEVERRLRSTLPPYMIPSHYEVISEIPTSASGKVDRKRLPAPTLRSGSTVADGAAPETDLERTIAGEWIRVFNCGSVPVDADFFLDLGGHSLFAALAASRLRGIPDTADVSVSDIYRYPTVRSLADAIQKRTSARRHRVDHPAAQKARTPVSSRRHRVAGILQAVGAYIVEFLLFYPLLLVALAAGPVVSLPVVAGTLVLTSVSYLPFTLAVSVVVKWAVIGRYRAGRYPLWSGYFLRWWFVRHVQGLVPLQWLAGTRFMAGYCRLMGANVGADCHIGTVFVGAFDLLTIGDRASINLDTNLVGSTVEDGMLIIGPIRIGTDCLVGAHTVLAPDTEIADGAELAEHSMLPQGARIPAGQCWAGSPARHHGRGRERAGSEPALVTNPIRPLGRVAFNLAQLLGMVALPLLPLIAAAPGGLIMLGLYAQSALWSLLAAPLAAILFVSLFCAETLLVKWTLLGRVRAGRYPVQSGFYVRKWFVDRVLQMNGVLMNSLFSTLYALPFLRALGAHVGRGAEVERVAYVTPDLLDLRPGSFIADAVYLGAPRIDRGEVHLGPTVVGTRTFVGNSALLPVVQTVADGCLVVCSRFRPRAPHRGPRGSDRHRFPSRDAM